MIPKLVLAVLVALAPAASAQVSDYIAPFDGLFDRSVAAGMFAVGEDTAISAHFAKGATIVSVDFRVVEAHREAPFNSGVGVWLTDDKQSNAIRIAIRDVEGEPSLILLIQSWRDLGLPGVQSAIVEERRLSIVRGSVGSFTLARNPGGKTVVRIDGQEILIHPEFSPTRVLAQVFCAEGWIRFGDVDLAS